MSRGWIGRGVRVVSGIGVVALVGAAVAGGLRLPPAEPSTAADGTAVDVPPSAVALTCPGPLVLPEAGKGDAAFQPVPVAPVTSVLAAATSSAGGTLVPLGGTATVGTLAPGSAVVGVPGVRVPLVLTARAGEDAPRATAAFGSVVTAGDLRGLSAASCQAPTTDAWLVGGATDLGSTDQLVLTAAGATPAEVSVDVYGPSGRVDTTADHYVVAPGASKTVVLAAVAPEQRRLVVHVSASGGPVTAYVQDNRLDGFTPKGTDLVVAGQDPARRQVLAGVSVVAAGVDDPLAGQLRLMVPGSKGTTAHVQVLGPDGLTDLPGAASVDLDAGQVTDVPLGGLPAGTYTVVVDAGRPVVAGALVARAGAPTATDPDASAERAWVASSTAGQGGTVAVPPGTQGTLVLAAVPTTATDAPTGNATGTLRTIGASGRVVATRTVSLAAGRTATWAADALLGQGALAPGARPAATQDHVVAVDLTTEGAAPVRLAWALVAQVQRPDGVLVSVLRPTSQAADASSVTVRRDPRLGTED
ncbi:DUF5719 family protein [Cellulomonas sp. HZM]|uniref:DUF5719 family protein n=1 Tax=Cellulomonas sp. HZM TaxID=1454010 RepID=UPI0004930D26|nr:DUF5719 family protein [Cellulomonas sp. HZM]